MSGFEIFVEKKNFSMNIVTLLITIEYLILEDFNMNILTRSGHNWQLFHSIRKLVNGLDHNTVRSLINPTRTFGHSCPRESFL